MAKALIFIPDISGFTKFMTEAEIENSYGVITELINSILDANKSDLRTSEIEGDAVLFYKIGDPPPLAEIIEQAKKMFIDFHTELAIIDKNKGSQNKLQALTHNLTLKFIVHYGDIEEVQIQNFDKLLSSDVILAHRLLKNHVPNHEYLLLSDQYLQTQKPDIYVDEWVHLEPDIEIYENFGQVKVKYVPLKHLRKLIPSAVI